MQKHYATKLSKQAALPPTSRARAHARACVCMYECVRALTVFLQQHDELTDR